MIVCAGNGEDFSFAKSLGVGLVESAIGLMQICQKESVDSLVFIGSAGAYSKEVKLFDLYIADSATQIELSFLQDKAYTPLDNHIQSGILQENVSYETFANKAIINSSNYITTDENLALRFAKAGILLENMEFFSIMKVAQYFNIPCLGVFCVSNYTHQNAHNEFMANHHKVKEILSHHSELIQQISINLAKHKGL
ncbi:purine nucleoside phosphorylase [Helicobacter cinaedi PAGU611]|uniref:5'-methylthioadenosine/S-adenosylhomocysteine nucleosidase family protein n=1 Tax=Helicobacter cinaedi TaxID=213 RepID=UPI00025D370F|nr:purine-nucleoside phosphorylase [Helicobacter cinaedi]AWK62614.1 purine-nucleoside phosphorylase [Helicobacter cinaedi]QOQ96751.1 purine-nucleoside phosphorylase [Helicobacter cinaedi]BAM13206.1 purine nucleoside phosphorylase [Helicobacter cinaedi PAGU611]